MTERERLIELLDKGDYLDGYGTTVNEKLADILLENGVITLPCKLYDTVYLLVKGKAEVFEATVRRFSINHKCELIIVIEHKENGYYRTGNYKWSSFGKWAFLSREEAERKLRGEC